MSVHCIVGKVCNAPPSSCNRNERLCKMVEGDVGEGGSSQGNLGKGDVDEGDEGKGRQGGRGRRDMGEGGVGEGECALSSSFLNLFSTGKVGF